MWYTCIIIWILGTIADALIYFKLEHDRTKVYTISLIGYICFCIIIAIGLRISNVRSGYKYIPKDPPCECCCEADCNCDCCNHDK